MSKNKVDFIKMDIDFEAIKDLSRSLKSLPEVMKKELKKAVEDVILIIEGEAKQRCPVDTGRLRASINHIFKSWSEGYVGTNVEYAPTVEYGSDPYPIVPKNGKYLVFDVVDSVQIFNKRTGQPLKKNKENKLKIFTKRVEHKGNVAQPFLEPAFEIGKDVLEKHFKAAMDRVWKWAEKELA